MADAGTTFGMGVGRALREAHYLNQGPEGEAILEQVHQGEKEGLIIGLVADAAIVTGGVAIAGFAPAIVATLPAYAVILNRLVAGLSSNPAVARTAIAGTAVATACATTNVQQAYIQKVEKGVAAYNAENPPPSWTRSPPKGYIVGESECVYLLGRQVAEAIAEGNAIEKKCHIKRLKKDFFDYFNLKSLEKNPPATHYERCYKVNESGGIGIGWRVFMLFKSNQIKCN